MKINKLLESKELKEGITNTEPVVKFQGKSSHTFTKDKKWEVDLDEKGNIVARTRYGKPYYFKGHINDKVNDFPSTDEDNIILAAREQYGLKFGKKTESFEKDGGPFWYFSKHGLGPGMLPKGVNVVDTIEDDNFGTYVALDKVLSTQELKDYELKEKKPPMDKNKMEESIDGWDNRTGVIKRIANYLYDNPKATPPKGYIPRFSREYDYAASIYGDYVTTSFGNISTNELMQYARDNKLLDDLKEASYGGAFDIADDQYFTREDIEDAAEKVMDHIQETFTEPYHLGGTWFENGQWIVNVQGEQFDEYEVSLPIDMRKIKAPRDLKDKFSLGMAAKLIAQIKEYNGLNENTAISSMYEFDDDVDDLTYYYDDEEFKRMLDEEPYNEIASKQVPDSDGFLTDYTMYRNMNDGTYVFILGDKDIYTPDNSDFDWECDTEEEAREWFDNYVGFDDDLLDEGWSSILEEAETETSPIVHKKSDGSYMVATKDNKGYVAYNKDDECIGNISASNETEAKNKFNSNKFDE